MLRARTHATHAVHLSWPAGRAAPQMPQVVGNVAHLVPGEHMPVGKLGPVSRNATTARA